VAAVVTDSKRNPVVSRRLDDLLRDAEIQDKTDIEVAEY
jgi:hypothetical protein